MSRINIRYLVTAELDGGDVTFSSEHTYIAGTKYQRLLLNKPEISQQPSSGLVIPSDTTIEVEDKEGLFSWKLRDGEELRKKLVKVERYDVEQATSTTIIYAPIWKVSIKGKIVTFLLSPIDDEILSTLLPSKKYTADDWDTAAKGSPRDTNGSTIKNPSSDQGQFYPVMWGHAKKVQALYVFHDEPNSEYYYIFNRGVIEATDADRAAGNGKIVVYSNKVVVATSEYTIGDGTQGSPFPGYAYVKFTKQKHDASGNFLPITVDFYASKFGGATAERNVGNVVKTLMSDSDIGVGETCNATSFAAFAAHMTANNIYTDGGLEGGQKSLREILHGEGGLISDCSLGSILRKNTSNEWEVLIDEAQESSEEYFGNGFQDEPIAIAADSGPIWTWDTGAMIAFDPMVGWVKKNIIDKPEVLSETGNATTLLRYEYRYNNWDQAYPLNIERTVNSGIGSPVTIRLPFIRNSETVDRLAYYRQQRELLGAPPVKISINEDGQDLDLLQRVSSKWQWRENGALYSQHYDEYLIESKEGATPQFDFTLRRYNASLYDYQAGTLPSDPVDDTKIDYSETDPDAPTNVQVTESTRQAPDGTTVGVVAITADEVAVNFASMKLGYRIGINGIWFFAPGTDQDGDGNWKLEKEGLTPGQIYRYGAMCVSPFGREGPITEITPGTQFPGDEDAPDVPTAVTAAAKPGMNEVVWTHTKPSDFGEYGVYRYTSDTPASASKIAEVRSKQYLDPDITAGQVYYYWITSIDRTENESDKSSSANCTAKGAASSDPPSTPDAPTKDAEGNYQSSDGTTLAYFDITMPAMPSGAAYMNLLQYITGADPKIVGQVTSGAVNVRADDLTPGMAYNYKVVAYSGGGGADTSSALGPLTAPGDTIKPGNVSVRTPRCKIKTWTFPWTRPTVDENGDPLNDLMDYHIQVSTVSNFASTIVDIYENTTEFSFTYDSASYGDILYCRVKARDNSENESNSWSSTMWASCTRLVTDDHGDGTITDVKIVTLTVAKLTTGTITGQTITISATSSIVIAASGHIIIQSGAYLDIYGSSGLNIKSGGAIRLESGSQLSCLAGAIAITATGSLTMSAGSMTLSGGTLALSGATINMTAGTFTISASGALVMSAGTMTLSGGTFTLSGATVAISASALTISSTGQLIVTNTAGIQINSTGGVNLSTGADLTLNFTDAATAFIYWDGGSIGDMYLAGSSTVQMTAPYTEHPTLEINCVTDGLGYLNIGGISDDRWYYIIASATDTVQLKVGSSTLDVTSSGAEFSGKILLSGWQIYVDSGYLNITTQPGTEHGIIIDPTAGNLLIDGTLTENYWSLDIDKTERWELFESVLSAFRNHDGSGLPEKIKVYGKKTDKNGKETVTHGKRLSDLIQVLYECVDEIKADLSSIIENAGG